MFYHARVVLKPERAKEAKKIAFEPDLVREDLVMKIALPFSQERQFFCGGVVVNPSKVEEIKFNRTDQNSKTLYPIIVARLRMSGAIHVVQPWAVSAEGQDITREILEEAAGVATPSLRKTNENSIDGAKQSDRIFIVHGHDLKAVDQIEILLHRFGLTPVILKDAPSGGRTVIEKFEIHSNVGAAIVLLTPDDIGGLNTTTLAPRARQNVIWEWGYLIGRLGRGKVICIYKGGVEMPSDLNGLVTIHVADDVREKTDEIRRELREAGYHIA